MMGLLQVLATVVVVVVSAMCLLVQVAHVGAAIG